MWEGGMRHIESGLVWAGWGFGVSKAKESLGDGASQETEARGRQGGRVALGCPDRRGSEDVVEQVVIISEGDDPEGAAQLIPEFFSGGELTAALLIGEVAQLKYLVDVEGQEIENEKVHGDVLLAVPVVMLDVVALVL